MDRMSDQHTNGPGGQAQQPVRPAGGGMQGFNLTRQSQRGKPKTVFGKLWSKVCAACRRVDSIDRSFFVFSKAKGAKIRPFVLSVVSHKAYKAIMMTIVLTNIVYLGADDPKCDAACLDANPTRKLVFMTLDLFYTICFTIDVLAQATALNFIIGPGAYLKNGWSWIDFLTTLTGYIQYLPLGSSSNNLSGLRALRALRPLRALNSIPGLRRLVQALLMSIPLLIDVFLLLMWIFAVFGIIALQVFQGALRGRCEIYGDSPFEPPFSPDAPALPPPFMPPDPALLNATMTTGRRLWEGVLSFSHRQLLRGGGGGGGGGGGSGEDSTGSSLQIVSGLENWPCALISPGLGTCPASSECLWTDDNPNYGYTSFDNFGATSLQIFTLLTLCNWCDVLLYPLMNAIGPGPAIPFNILLILFGSYFAMQLLIAVLSSKFAQIEAQTPKKKKKRRRKNAKPLRRIDTEEFITSQARGYLSAGGTGDRDSRGSAKPLRSPFAGLQTGQGWSWAACRARVASVKGAVHWKLYNSWVWFHARFLIPTKRRDMSPLRLKVYHLCHHPWFGHAATICVVINTLVFAVQFADEPETYTMVLEKINMALTGCFIVEFLIKHIGLGYVRYWSDPWNDLDGIIVIISIVDIILTYALAGSQTGAMQALRTFRVLRVMRSLRLLARIPALRRLMTLIIKCMVALKNFFLLLSLFIYIFAILGYQLFAGNPAFSCGVANNCRYNFNTLWESLYTSFQILCMDDWLTVAWQGMQAKGISAILYFVVWIVVGNFILLTLFLAILISTFQDEPTPTPEEIEEAIKEEGAYDAMSQSTAPSDMRSSASSGEVNALAQRVMEQKQNKLDPSTVRKMKTWLMMMGVEHGLTMQDMEELREQLDRDYEINPDRFLPGGDYLAEEEMLHRQQQQRGSGTQATLRGKQPSLKTQLSKRAAMSKRFAPESISGAGQDAGKAIRLSAWLAQEDKGLIGTAESPPTDEHTEEIQTVAHAGSPPKALSGPPLMAHHRRIHRSQSYSCVLSTAAAGTAAQPASHHQPADTSGISQAAADAKADAVKYSAGVAQRRMLERTGAFAAALHTVQRRAWAAQQRPAASSRLSPFAQHADNHTAAWGVNPWTLVNDSQASIHGLLHPQCMRHGGTVRAFRTGVSGSHIGLIKSHSLGSLDPITLMNLRALAHASAEGEVHGDPATTLHAADVQQQQDVTAQRQHAPMHGGSDAARHSREGAEAGHGVVMDDSRVSAAEVMARRALVASTSGRDADWARTSRASRPSRASRHSRRSRASAARAGLAAEDTCWSMSAASDEESDMPMQETDMRFSDTWMSPVRHSAHHTAHGLLHDPMHGSHESHGLHGLVDMGAHVLANAEPMRNHAAGGHLSARAVLARQHAADSLPATPQRFMSAAAAAGRGLVVPSDRAAVRNLFSNPLFNNPLYAGGPASMQEHQQQQPELQRVQHATATTAGPMHAAGYGEGHSRQRAATAAAAAGAVHGQGVSHGWGNPMFSHAWSPQTRAIAPLRVTNSATATYTDQTHGSGTTRSLRFPPGPIGEATVHHGRTHTSHTTAFTQPVQTHDAMQGHMMAAQGHADTYQQNAWISEQRPDVEAGAETAQSDIRVDDANSMAVFQLLSTLRHRRRTAPVQPHGGWGEHGGRTGGHDGGRDCGRPVAESVEQPLLQQARGASLDLTPQQHVMSALGTPGMRGSVTDKGRVTFHPHVDQSAHTDVDLSEREREQAEEDARLQALASAHDEEHRRSRVYLESSSLWLLRAHHPLRVWLAHVVSAPYFTNFILVLIAGSSLVLALQNPGMDHESDLYKVLHMFDIVFTAFFAVEMVLKIVTKGMVLHRGAYWRSGWDIFDGTIVVTSILALTPLAQQLTIFRTLRLLRIIRPLRLLRQWKGMQLVVETLVCSLPAVGNVIAFGAFLFAIFAILGVQLFAGRMGMCNQTVVDGEPVSWRNQCVEGQFVCGPDDICNTGDTVDRSWSEPFRNFDNIGNAMLTLFTLATLDGFMGVINNLIDCVGVNQQPKVNNAPWYGLYVIAFIFLGSWFWVNLLVSVVVEFYTKMVQEKGDVLASKQAKEWIKLFKFSAPKSQDAWKQVPVPSSPLRALAYHIASHPKFDPFIMAVIILNVLAMATDHWGAAQTYVFVMTILNFIFMGCFLFEMAVKMLALGIHGYFKDHWNKLDFFIIVVSIPDLVSAVVPALQSLSFMTVFRVFRVARLFKLINKAKGLRTLFNTLISSLPAIFNVGSLLLLLMFIYTVLGMNVFGSTDRYPDPILNFNNFATSLLTMFRVFTGDGWSDVMARGFDCNDQGMQCNMTSGVSIAAGFFFPSFVLFAQFVMLNLVIAVILDNFIESAQSEGLLKTTNFVELLRMVITLKVFVRMLRIKVEQLKKREMFKRAPASRYPDLGGLSGSGGSMLFGRFLPLPGASSKGGDLMSSSQGGKKEN